MMAGKNGLGTFIGQFAKYPMQLGTFAPSSTRLARRMLENLKLEKADVVFELGAGTGAITGEILKLIKPDATFVAVEINSKMAAHLRSRFPGIHVVEDTAEKLGEFRRQNGIGLVDCMVCGVPWASFSEEEQDRLLMALEENMRPGAQFATLACVHSKWSRAAKRLRNELTQRFDGLHATRPVWCNMPPVFVYKCRSKGNGSRKPHQCRS